MATERGPTRELENMCPCEGTDTMWNLSYDNKEFCSKVNIYQRFCRLIISIIKAKIRKN